MSRGLDRLVLGRQAARSQSLPVSQDPGQRHLFLLGCRGKRPVARAALWPCAAPRPDAPRRILGVGSPIPILSWSKPEKVTWDARSVLAAGTKLSAPQTHAPLLPRGYGRESSRGRSPPGPGFPSVTDASLVVSLMGHLVRLPQNTHLARGSEPAGPSASSPPKFLSPSREAGLVPVGKTVN